MTKVPEIGITRTKTKAQKQKGETLRHVKNKTEEQWSKVDYDTMLGTRQSFHKRDLQRKSLYFESTEEAKVRTMKRKALEEAGIWKTKRHSPDHTLVAFDKEKGVDLGRFRASRKSADPAPRRRLNQMYGGEIMPPVPCTNASLRETLQTKIMNEEYHLGEIITPRCYRKLKHIVRAIANSDYRAHSAPLFAKLGI